MAVTLNSIKCPECGATLNIESDRDRFFCSYCGAKVVLTNENEHIYRHIDEAGIKQAETERAVRMRELDLEENESSLQKTVTIIWIILSLVLILIAILIMLFGGNDDMPGWAAGFLFLFYACAPIIGGGAYLVFKYLPNKENDKRIRRHGGIRFPESLLNYTEMSYDGAKSILVNAGFRNISCVNLHDLTLGLLQKPGRVAQISIDGKVIESVGAYYMPDSEIVITYHGR